jgi:hypothetical protein
LSNPFIPGDVKYSLFARKVTLRGTTNGMKTESLKDKWFDAMITGPTVGTWRKPVTFGRKASMRRGLRKDFNVV